MFNNDMSSTRVFNCDIQKRFFTDIHRYPEIRSHVHMGPMKNLIDGKKIKKNLDGWSTQLQLICPSGTLLLPEDNFDLYGKETSERNTKWRSRTIYSRRSRRSSGRISGRHGKCRGCTIDRSRRRSGRISGRHTDSKNKKKNDGNWRRDRHKRPFQSNGWPGHRLHQSHYKSVFLKPSKILAAIFQQCDQSTGSSSVT